MTKNMNAFIDYSSSSSDDDDDNKQSFPSETLSPQDHPPPPNALLSENQPSQLPPVVPYQSREDKFLVHVYLPIDVVIMKSFTNILMSQTRVRMVGQPNKASFTELSDYHVSVSRPVTIRYAAIPHLINDLRKGLQCCKQFNLQIHHHVAGFLNSSLRRLFVAAPVTCETKPNMLLELIKVIDDVFQRQGLPTFFKFSKPHVSFAFTETTDVYPLYKDYFIPTKNKQNENQIVSVQNVICTVGERSYHFPLT